MIACKIFFYKNLMVQKTKLLWLSTDNKTGIEKGKTRFGVLRSKNNLVLKTVQ